MANIKLYPPYGTLEQTSSVKFEISDIKIEKFKLNVENATNGVKIDIKSLEKMGDVYAGVMDLNIPEHSSQSSISVFAHIDESQSDGSYKTFQICPAIFDINEESNDVDNLIITPSFIGQKDLCSIKIKGEPLSSSTFSINDKILKVMINEAGYGSIHFRGGDIVGNKELESLNKIPVYSYEGENNTSKVFSGLYINILPSNISIHAGVDPRCDVNSESFVSPPGSWVRPDECDEEPCNPEIEICPCDPATEDCECNPDIENCNKCNPEIQNCSPPEVCVQSVDIPITCGNGDVTIGFDACRIHNNSVALLNNGMAIYAYTSPDNTYETLVDDERYNINRVFIAAQSTSPTVNIITHKDVVVESKTADEDFRIHVEEDIWNALDAMGDLSNSNVYVVFYDDAFGYQKAKVDSITIDEYIGDNIIIALAGDTNVSLDSWVFCINSVFYNDAETPNIRIDGVNDFMSLPFVRNDFEDGAYVRPVNVVIATNRQYVGVDGEAYVYFIVEAVTENNLSQLYFNSLSLGKDDTFTQESYGWVRITDDTQGNNRNPVAKMDSVNNLHVIFESDRGGINQLYYGNIGLDYIPVAAATFSASIDKYSEFLSTGETPFDYFKPLLLKNVIDLEYLTIPEFDTESLLTDTWHVIQSNGGNTSLSDTINYLDDVTITANPLTQEAIAIASLQIWDDPTNPSVDSSWLQYNYQISFDLIATIEQANNLTDNLTVSENEMDSLFNQWKETFTISIDDQVSNQPVYVDGSSNKFVIGRVDNNFDRLVPLVGSYKYNNTIINPSDIDSQIKILKNDNNLRDFTFGIMFEKTYFKASNIQTSSDYVDSGYDVGGYSSEIVETIYTGKAKLVAFIRTAEDGDVRADYIIVREFPESLEISESSTYDIIVNYVKIDSDQTGNLLNTYQSQYTNKYLGSLTLIIDEIPRFSQSFISTLDSEYNFFDIGLGTPNGGYYVADKMSPSKLGIFDNISATLNISNITISSPTYTYNSEVVSLPPTVRDITKLKVFEEDINSPNGTSSYQPDGWDNDLVTLNFASKEDIKYFITHSENSGDDYEELFNVEDFEKVSIEFDPGAGSDRMIVTTEFNVVLHDTGFISTSSSVPEKFDVDVDLVDNIYIKVEVGNEVGNEIGNLIYNFTAYFKKVYNDNTFIQTPITFEGINQSASLDIGICDDLHIAWQSNRDKYWDIYYTNSVDELSPFRYETQITNTESNSIKPSVSVSRKGSRMISWNDNRKGSYTIYAARSLGGYACNQKLCEKKMLENFDSQVVECSLSFEATSTTSGYYNFVIYFYSDSGLDNLYKTITLENNESKWFINGDSIVDSLVYNDSDVFLGVLLPADEQIIVSYSPDKDDKIFDIVLYAKLNSVLTLEETE